MEGRGGKKMKGEGNGRKILKMKGERNVRNDVKEGAE